jgi:transcriptional regulator with XRE-family HTH domain
MSPQEYRDALAALGLTQAAAAKLLGVDPRTSRRWALGERKIPKLVEIVLNEKVERFFEERRKAEWEERLAYAFFVKPFRGVED